MRNRLECCGNNFRTIIESGEELVLIENGEIVGTLIDDLTNVGVFLRRLERTSAIPLEDLFEAQIGKVALLQATIIFKKAIIEFSIESKKLTICSTIGFYEEA